MKLVVLALGLIVLAAVGICGCGGKEHEYTKLTHDNTNTDWQPLPSLVSEEELLSQTNVDVTDENNDSPQLTALADTLEEAQEIADLYGIELNSYSYGVATYRTDKDISELINFGLENDYPTLAPNNIDKLYTEQDN